MICSDDCRKAAAQCVNLGKRAGAGKQRGILFDMARAWEALAKHALRLERLKGSTRRRSQPQPAKWCRRKLCGRRPETKVVAISTVPTGAAASCGEIFCACASREKAERKAFEIAAALRGEGRHGGEHRHRERKTCCREPSDHRCHLRKVRDRLKTRIPEPSQVIVHPNAKCGIDVILSRNSWTSLH